MKTIIFHDDILSAAKIIINGGLVAVPTETVYGLAGNGLDQNAISKIYEVKGRPKMKPISLMVADAKYMPDYCVDIPEAAFMLAEKYWPGPLTIVLKASERFPKP